MQIDLQSDSIIFYRRPIEHSQYSGNEGCVGSMPNEPTDGELIKSYLDGSNEKAFETLFQRHYDVTFQRFLKHCRDPDNAADLTQQLWLQMVRHLENYQDDGKFPLFLMRCGTNLLTDFWRRKGVKDKVISESSDQELSDPVQSAVDPRSNTETSTELKEQIDYLVEKLIPSLPCEQRLVFLLKHESEYWEGKQRLSWQHLAKLNGIEEQTAWDTFEKTRNTMLSLLNRGVMEQEPSCEAMLIFLVWTQIQRPFKNQEYTWSYFSRLLDVPENTLKTRYRAALKQLGKGLSDLNTNE